MQEVRSLLENALQLANQKFGLLLDIGIKLLKERLITIYLLRSANPTPSSLENVLVGAFTGISEKRRALRSLVRPFSSLISLRSCAAS
jgi:hypothetical protein